jgi:hypothetical protein
MTSNSRRDFLRAASAIAGGTLLPTTMAAKAACHEPLGAARPDAVNVVVWDEQQPAQKEAYADFLGNQISAHLAGQPGISVKSVKRSVTNAVRWLASGLA